MKDIRKIYRERLEASRSRTPCLEPVYDDTAVSGIVGEALRELETARRKAEATLATARQQASRLYREARKDARRLLSKARAKAERLETIARSRAATIEDAARVEGLKAGQGAARAEVRLSCEEGLECLIHAAEDSLAAQERFVASSREQVLELMMAMVRRVVGVLSEEIDGLVRTNLLAALEEHFSPDEMVYIRLNPVDLDAVERALHTCGGEGSTEDLTRERKVRLRSDPSLERGCCRLWSERTGIGFCFSDRLTALEKELSQALAHMDTKAVPERHNQC